VNKTPAAAQSANCNLHQFIHVQLLRYSSQLLEQNKKLHIAYLSSLNKRITFKYHMTLREGRGNLLKPISFMSLVFMSLVLCHCSNLQNTVREGVWPNRHITLACLHDQNKKWLLWKAGFFPINQGLLKTWLDKSRPSKKATFVLII